MKANYGKIVVGVIIGIMAALTLTLNVWGVEWYKVITSTVAGIIIGLLISDYHVTVTIFKTGLQRAINSSWKRAQRIKNGELNREQRHSFDISIIRTAYILLMQFLALLMLGFFIVITIHFNLFKSDDGRYIMPIMVIGVLFVRIYVLIISSLDFDTWAKKLDEFQIENIWNKKPGSNGKNSLTYNYQENKKIDFKELTVDMSFKEIIVRALASSGLVMKHNLNSDWDDIKGFFKIAAFIILAIILFLTTSLPILPFWIIKQIGKHGNLLSVAAAITIGSVIGSLTHSQLIGLGSGLGFMATSYLIERLFKKINLFYMFRNEGAFCKFAESI